MFLCDASCATCVSDVSFVTNAQRKYAWVPGNVEMRDQLRYVSQQLCVWGCICSWLKVRQLQYKQMLVGAVRTAPEHHSLPCRFEQIPALWGGTEVLI